jgi:hypothetical protein
MGPIYSERNQSVTLTSLVNPGDRFEVWYQARTSPLDRGEDWQHDTASTLTRNHGGPEYNFMRVLIDQRTGKPIPGQERLQDPAEEERDISTACKRMLQELEKTPKPEENPRQHAKDDQPKIADDPEDATQATVQPLTLTEQQRLTDEECDKFIAACAAVFEDAWNPPPRESPNEPFWITAARHGLNILALHNEREGVDAQTQTEVTIPGILANMYNTRRLSNTSTQHF